MKVARKPAGRTNSDAKPVKRTAAAQRGRGAEGSARQRRTADSTVREARPRTRRPHEQRGMRQGPQTAPAARPAERPARPKTTSQAKARAKARKAKAPKAIRPPLRERLLARLESLDLRPQALLARIPFVVLVIGSLAVGLGVTLWLSTDAAQRSYELGNARELNQALVQQKEALERDVLEAQSAPALADAARDLGMIPSRETAHLVQDPAGNWVVVGEPKPAEGAPPPPLNTKLPDEVPPAPAKPAPPAPPAPKPGAAGEVPRLLTPALPGTAALPGVVPLAGVAPVPGQAGPALVPSATDLTPHLPAGSALPGPALLVPGSALPGSGLPLPAGDTLVAPPAGPVALPVPTVAAVPPVTDVAVGAAVPGAPLEPQ